MSVRFNCFIGKQNMYSELSQQILSDKDYNQGTSFNYQPKFELEVCSAFILKCWIHKKTDK